MKHFNNRFSVAVLSFLIGAATVWGIDYHVAKKALAQKELSNSEDPFVEMRKMREQMFKDFWDRPQFMTSSFSSEFSQREDDKFVYYEIDLKGKKPGKLEVEVKDGQVSISGKIEEKNDEDGTQSIFSSSFHRSFPTPSHVIEDQFKMEQEGNKIIIKFPKT